MIKCLSRYILTEISRSFIMRHEEASHCCVICDRIMNVLCVTVSSVANFVTKLQNLYMNLCGHFGVALEN